MQGVYGLALTEVQGRVFNLLKQQPVNFSPQLLHLYTQTMKLSRSAQSVYKMQARCLLSLGARVTEMGKNATMMPGERLISMHSPCYLDTSLRGMKECNKL